MEKSGRLAQRVPVREIPGEVIVARGGGAGFLAPGMNEGILWDGTQGTSAQTEVQSCTKGGVGESSDFCLFAFSNAGRDDGTIQRWGIQEERLVCKEKVHSVWHLWSDVPVGHLGRSSTRRRILTAAFPAVCSSVFSVRLPRPAL